MVLVRNEAVAVHPVDVKAADNFDLDGLVGGFDFAGTIVAVAPRSDSEVPTFAPGDRVCGTVFGMNKLRPLDGAFAQYVGALADLTMKIPSSVSFAEAASFPTGVGTVVLALRSLFQQDTPVPMKVEPSLVLVYGASSTTGMLALQYLKAMGHRVIATASPKNSDLCTSYGAEKVFDYRSPTCAADIKSYTQNRLRYTLDCISDSATMEICYGCLGRAGGRYVTLEPFSRRIAKARPTVRPEWVLQPMLFGMSIPWPEPYTRDAQPSMRIFGRQLYKGVQQRLQEGQLRPPPIDIQNKGFAGIIDSVQRLRNKAVSGQKLVCIIPH